MSVVATFRNYNSNRLWFKVFKSPASRSKAIRGIENLTKNELFHSSTFSPASLKREIKELTNFNKKHGRGGKSARRKPSLKKRSR